MKSLFTAPFASLLTLVATLFFNQNTCFANTLPAMPVGFYQIQSTQKIIYVFQELIHDDSEVDLGISGVTSKGYLLKTVVLPNDGIELKWGGKRAEIVVRDPSHFEVTTFKKDKVNETLSLQFLGESQIDAAKSLKIARSFPATRYVSHRGTAQIPATHSHSLFPGNTIPAMNMSLLNGFDGFELDVQMTADKQFAVSHDNKLSVSTDCAGYVSDRPLSEVTDCEVHFTGFLPEKKWFHSRANIQAKIPSLQAVLDQFISDSRLKRIVIDTKPGVIEDQVEAFAKLLAKIPDADQTKIIFLIRDSEIQRQLIARGFTLPLYAIESSSGWEPLEKPEAYFDDGTPPEAISLSVGIGLGFAGLNARNFAEKIAGIWSALSSVISILTHDHDADIGLIMWSKRNQKHFLELMNRAKDANTQIVGWTVNTPLKIKWLRKNAPELQYVISDLPFRTIAKLQIDELESLH